MFGTDINDDAVSVARRTITANPVDNVVCEVRKCDLLGGGDGATFSETGVDVILFNPPYVVTPDEEVGSSGIEASWAGGVDGRVVIDRAMPQIIKCLKEDSVGYMVLVDDNKVEEIVDWFEKEGVGSMVLGRRKARNEWLNILKFGRKVERKVVV